MEEQLISALLSGQKTVTIGNVEFEGLPVIKRDTQKKREEQAKREAQKLIRILNED